MWKLFFLTCAALILSAVPVISQTRLAAFVVTFPDSGPYQPETMTWMRDTMEQVDDFYAEQSYGQFILQSDSFGVYLVNLDHTATRQMIAAAAQQAARDAGVDLSPYTKFLYISPMTDYARAGYGDATGAWIALTNAPYIPNYNMIAHELGHHLFGLLHAHGIICTDSNGNSVPIYAGRGSSCTSLDYGDTLDVMGSGHGHFNALTKANRGWLTAQAVTADGTYTLQPFESQGNGVKVLLVMNRQDFTYSLEYRQPIGFDQTWFFTDDPAYVFGVIVHRALNGSELLQMNAPANGLKRPAMLAGQTFCDSDGRLSLSVVSATSVGATVAVKFGHCR